MNQEHTKRKLSGIISADVVGYSRLMEEDETRTIQNLEENKKLIRELVEEYKGRVVDAPGDNLLAEFSSVVNAVDCAVKVQNKLKYKNSCLPENNRMEFRIGVNLGDVVEEDDRIYGDGINIAARIEKLAEPGGICLSKTAYDHVKTKLDLGYEYLGEHNLKNITEPVSVYRVLTDSGTAGKVIGEKKYLGRITRRAALTIIIILFAAAAGSTGWIIYSKYSKKVEQASPDKMAYPLPEKPSLAVLPFVNLSGKPEQDYFSDGLTDEIISGLSKNPDLFVIARNSSFVYKDKPVKIKQVSEDLGVRFVLEGSVRRDGDRVKITATLIDAIKGYLIWSETYDRKMEDIFALQSEIMWQIFRELRIKLARGNRPPDYLQIKKVSVEYTETFYLLYRYYKQRTPERLETAKQLADKLIKIAPDPWVYYMRGSILVALSGPRGSKSGEEFLNAAEEDARELEKLDKGASYGLFGQIYLAKNEIQKALISYEKWIEYSPNSANAHFSIGFILILLKRYDEAIEHYELGLRIDPFPESEHFTYLGIAYSSPSPGSFSNLDKAKRAFEMALRPNKNNLLAQIYLTLIYSYENKMEKARFYANEILRTPFFSLEGYHSWPQADEETTRFHKELLRKAGIHEKENNIIEGNN